MLEFYIASFFAIIALALILAVPIYLYREMKAQLHLIARLQLQVEALEAELSRARRKDLFHV